MNTIDKLIKFVNQRPGLEFANYGDRKLYFREMREITADRTDFFNLLFVAQRRMPDLETKVTNYLKNNSGRIQMNEAGEITYCTGQYFPTEYRPAANSVLRSLIWDNYRNEKDADGQPLYKDGDALRKAIKRNFGRRINSIYFK